MPEAGDVGGATPRTVTLAFNGRASGDLKPPSALTETPSRSGIGGGEDLALRDAVVVKQVFELSPPGRDANTSAQREDPSSTDIVALEAVDGLTIFTSAGRLVDEVSRLQPEAITGGALDLTKFRDREEAQRSGDSPWLRLSVLDLDSTGLYAEAKELARSWVGGKLEDAAYEVGSYLGTKALMRKIESLLAGEEGLYDWSHGGALTAVDRTPEGDPRLVEAAKRGPMLVFIHGTASSTMGSYSELGAHEETWSKLKARFTGGIFAFEHRTFSKSPVENALELIQNLPAGARVSLVTHSRGGLVGDVVCLGALNREAIERFAVRPLKKDEKLDASRAAAAEDERAALARLSREKQQRAITVERYVRVAAPASGTRLLSQNLDVFLSGFLYAIQKAGVAVTATLATPVAGKVAASLLGVLKRVTLEIAKNRLDPSLVPGIAAMTIDSPLGRFLANPATPRSPVQLAVIAGDTHFSSWGFGDFRRRLASLFTDFAFFSNDDNDLVVDTEAMYRGLVPDGARYLFDRYSDVTHFRYFVNTLSREALRDWLTADNPSSVQAFRSILEEHLPWSRKRSAEPASTLPILVLVPDSMASDLWDADTGSMLWPSAELIARGELARLSVATRVTAELSTKIYRELVESLAFSYEVERFPYDWRQSLLSTASNLAVKLQELRDKNPDRAIHILAHGAGALLVERAMASDSSLWRALRNAGTRVLFAGAMLRGSYATAHALLGKTQFVRSLALLDPRGDLQSVVDILAAWPGFLDLLPAPDFASARLGAHLHVAWADWKANNQDRWFGDEIGVVLTEETLREHAQLWQAGPSVEFLRDVTFVVGRARLTPLGIELRPVGSNQVTALSFTGSGDGVVPWSAGIPQPLLANNTWVMPAEHADLTSSPDHFPALLDLLRSGRTDKLKALQELRGPITVDATLPDVLRDGLPPGLPSRGQLQRLALGGAEQRAAPSRKLRSLKVSVVAKDVRLVQQPVLVGHYVGDAIAGAERSLDEMLDGRLSERDRLGLYAGPLGTSVCVTVPRSPEDILMKRRPGAIVIGLGELNGQLSSKQLTLSVRTAVMNYLMTVRDALSERQKYVQLFSLLIGCNSSASITPAEATSAVVLGVIEANQLLAASSQDTNGEPPAVTELTFVELYQDTAIEAAYAVRALPEKMESELKRTGVQLDVGRTLKQEQSQRRRLTSSASNGYWPRLIVTDADRDENQLCAPECYEPRLPIGLSSELRDRICNRDKPCDCPACSGKKNEATTRTGDGAAKSVCEEGPSGYLPVRLKYVFLSQRARAESIVLQRQPGLIEKLLRSHLTNPRFDERLGKLLFQLMVPLDFKSTAREQSSLVLVVDSYSASLPWELVQADDKPLALVVAMVRQLATGHFRRTVSATTRDATLIVTNPATDCYEVHFGGSPLPSLAGAEKEGRAVFEVLSRGGPGRRIELVPPKSDALTVLSKLYERPYRILSIAAHGVFEARASDGKLRTGVVLSDGLLLTAVEISQMEIVPELVFLNCCHLGQIQGGPPPGSGSPNKLAQSISRELIDIGVRCVVVAGWAVDDEAAATFAGTFFEEMVVNNHQFGSAVFSARRRTYELHPSTNTWGAYQAYGDPNFRLSRAKSPENSRASTPASIDELLDQISRKHAELRDHKRSKQKPPSLDELAKWAEQLLSPCPPEWGRRADVHQAIAELYGQLGVAGFSRARELYLRAIAEADRNARVELTAIEQLANLEARLGEEIASGWVAQGEPLPPKARHDEGLRLIDLAIDRILALQQLGEADASRGGAPPTVANRERAGILASAYKRKAVVLATGPKPDWPAVSSELEKARQAYWQGEPGSSEPYLVINRVQLAGLLRDEDPEKLRADLVAACAAAAERYHQTPNFFDGASDADATVAEWLLTEPPTLTNSRDQLMVDVLIGKYRDLLTRIPSEVREAESVLKQLDLLAVLYQARNAAGDEIRAQVLRRIRTSLSA